MKVSPVQGPLLANSSNPTSSTDARQKAISMLSGNAQPVPDASSVSPEELSAVHSNKMTAEEPTVTEAPVEAPTTEEKPADPLSKQYALLAKREKALRIQAQRQSAEIKQQAEALKTKEAELAAREQEYKDGYISKQRLKESTLDALADAQISYDDLVQQVINNQTPQDPRTLSQINKLESTIRRLEEQLEGTKKNQAEQQDQSYKAAVRQIEQDATHLIKDNPEFETIQATGSIKDVVKLIEEVYKEEGRVMSVEEAAQEVEDYLLGEVEKFAKIQKVQKRLGLGASTAQSQPAQTQQPTVQTKQQQPMKTLTNAAASTRQLSVRERAILAARGELKS